MTNSLDFDVMSYQTALISWGESHFRAFPWRLTRDPYHVLLSEVMLHRTQALQVVPVYERFFEQYADIHTLAAASAEDLQQILYSLGLRWRVDLIKQMAVMLVDKFQGQVPLEKDLLLLLPGVSDYIASATRCFAWNLPESIIDTNVVRVVSRLFGLESRDSSRRSQRFKQLSRKLLDTKHPRSYNYALLDLADQICTKKRPPACTQCPLLPYCLHGQSVIFHRLSRAKPMMQREM